MIHLSGTVTLLTLHSSFSLLQCAGHQVINRHTQPLASCKDSVSPFFCHHFKTILLFQVTVCKPHGNSNMLLYFPQRCMLSIPSLALLICHSVLLFKNYVQQEQIFQIPHVIQTLEYFSNPFKNQISSQS